jgi:hypothetical protein
MLKNHNVLESNECSNLFDCIHNFGDNNREHSNILDRELAQYNNQDKKDDEQKYTKFDENLPCLIYRYKFTEEFMKELYQFSKIHQYDSRKDFKDEWQIWTDENKELVDEETNRLLKLGYEGDIMTKMFKSARYYFRKKSIEKKEPKIRRQYISVNRELLNAMDLHIEENIYSDEYKPKLGFIQFCNSNEELLRETVHKIYEQGVKDIQIIQDKIKKTYKNRYFMLVSKNK